ncbi:retrovirus-related Pol polyprotein from transposon RE1 [Trichonephila clavipes]|nr:retrovirus-related Pol polyprotein from transposon RE1 [Trichonephila clavipes]
MIGISRLKNRKHGAECCPSDQQICWPLTEDVVLISINKVASSEFQSTVQQIYRWKEEDFRVVKIEAELILEANRLQLMKQNLEKAENAYLSSFTSKKSKTLPGATAAAHGDPNGKNDYQKKGGKAIRSRDASKWHDAMDKEINVMKERKVWDLVDHPDNIKILENRWVYTIKYDENNKIVRYKARLVARGNTQLRDSDFATNRDDRVSMGGFITFRRNSTFMANIQAKNPLVCRPWKLILFCRITPKDSDPFLFYFSKNLTSFWTISQRERERKFMHHWYAQREGGNNLTYEKMRRKEFKALRGATLDLAAKRVNLGITIGLRLRGIDDRRIGRDSDAQSIKTMQSYSVASGVGSQTWECD